MITCTRKQSTKARKKAKKKKKKKKNLQSAQPDLQRLYMLELPNMAYKVTVLAVFIKTKTNLKLNGT